MSTHLVDRAVAVRIPAATINPDNPQWTEDVWLLLELGGDNNVFNRTTGERARNWSCIATGCEWQALSKVVERAAACCGGCLCFAGKTRDGWKHTEPEKYIKWWRDAMKNAVSLADLGTLGLWAELTLKFNAADEKSKWTVEDCATKLGREPETVDYYGTKQLVWYIDSNKPAEMMVWAGAYVEHAWYKCRVSEHGLGF